MFINYFVLVISPATTNLKRVSGDTPVTSWQIPEPLQIIYCQRIVCNFGFNINFKILLVLFLPVLGNVMLIPIFTKFLRSSVLLMLNFF